MRPANALTLLDTHVGIGIIDIGADPADRAGRPGLVPPSELDDLVGGIHASRGSASSKAEGAAASNLDLVQVNCNFYGALGRDNKAYLVARAIQVFTPGVPQVDEVGLLAGENGLELLSRSGVGRDINRHHDGRDEIDTALHKSVVGRLLQLIRLRNGQPDFGGSFSLQDSAATALRQRRDSAAAALAARPVLG